MRSAAARSEPLPNRACPDEADQAIMRHFLKKPGFLLARRCNGASLHDRLFALQVLGDDRAIAATYLRGRRAFARMN